MLLYFILLISISIPNLIRSTSPPSLKVDPPAFYYYSDPVPVEDLAKKRPLSKTRSPSRIDTTKSPTGYSAITVPPSSIKWPQYNPPGPYFFDTLCFGKGASQKSSCFKGSPFCQWYTQQDPACYDSRFVSVTTAPVQRNNTIPLHVKFFQFNLGVHLVEGTFSKRFYSLTVDECAQRCLRSASGFPSLPGQKLRCMSFDFYPFETWLAQAPYHEAKNKGICVLNNESKDTCRLRNEDQGLTEAELYYKSHCTTRPFSQLDGYYEVRDPRGALTPLLEYAGPKSLGLESPWGGSRWGIFHPNKPGYLPAFRNITIDCSIEQSGDLFFGPIFRGGFTPINDGQHCPGLMTKEDTEKLCFSRGGDLCLNQTDLDNISGRKLGCSFDQAGAGLIWHKQLPGGPKKKMFPRCCASYNMPLSNDASPVQTCKNYNQQNIDFCSKFRTVTDCLYSKQPGNPSSFIPESWTQGFGRGLSRIRQICLQRSQELPGYDCSGMELGGWTTKTNCLWCVAPGLDPLGGNGECRPGGSYGICPEASPAQKAVFALRFRSTCPDNIVCNLLKNFPDLKDDPLATGIGG